MVILTQTMTLDTKEGVCFYDLTSRLQEMVVQAKMYTGQMLVFTKHTTTAIRITENEERLLEDIKMHLEHLAPKNGRYLHDDTHLRQCPPDERMNGHSHVKALALNSSETIPIIDGKLALGQWQSVFCIDLDGKRTREIIVQIMGE